jgi:hypothetical protein
MVAKHSYSMFMTEVYTMSQSRLPQSVNYDHYFTVTNTAHLIVASLQIVPRLRMDGTIPPLVICLYDITAQLSLFG